MLLLACCFFFLSRLEDHAGGKTWVGEQCPEIIEDSLWKQYETSFYWAVTTLSTVGYGDVSPVSGSERIAVAFWVPATTAIHVLIADVAMPVEEPTVAECTLNMLAGWCS